ncbi:MAG: hypothetical protein HRT35_31260, partial [Algicola sp.]|nr:hypothetical protein [Algicola sp.]
MKHLLKLNKILIIVTTLLGLSLCSLVVSAQPERGDRRPTPHEGQQRGSQHGKAGGPENMIEELGIS